MNIFRKTLSTLLLFFSFISITQGYFSDAGESICQNAVNYLYDEGIVTGYPDGSFKPQNLINRAELLKIVIGAAVKKGHWDETTMGNFASQSCFSDVPANQWYTKYVCYAKNAGIISGYADNTFKPDQTIIAAEAHKILLTAFEIPFDRTDPWYAGIEDIMTSDYQISGQPAMQISREVMADDLTRVLLKIDGSLESYLVEGKIKGSTTAAAPAIYADAAIDGEQLIDGMYVYDTGKFIYRFDKNLTDDDSVRRAYMKKYIELNETSYYFLEDFFGFSLTDKMTILFLLSDLSSSGAGNNTIQNDYISKITSTDVNNMTLGNSHELSHLIFKDTGEMYKYLDLYGGYNWFREGLANFVSNYERYGSNTADWGLLCEDTGWAEGYTDANNQKVYNRAIVPYYDFSVRYPDESGGSYSQQSRLSAYQSGQCFWIYIKEKYGENKLKSIFPLMHEKTSSDLRYYYLLVGDIIKGAIGDDLTDLVKSRYNYTEPESLADLQ